MAVTSIGMVFFPHCDLHVARTGTPPLRVSFQALTFDDGKPDRYALADITKECAFDFFAPHKEVGKRLEGLPSVDPLTGLVTARELGVFLFQVRWREIYLVGRLQVHDRAESWWFGNDSITTAFEPDRPGNPGVAHAQPSLYAKFSDDATGADRIGDITGHGYVTLTPDDAAKLAITPQGRLRGLAETVDPTLPTGIKGTFLGVTNGLPVRVVDYAKTRQDLIPVQTPDVAHADDLADIVFIPEGFIDDPADRALFDEVVTKTVQDIFDKPRHEPYAMLEGSFNIFKAFLPSREHYLTTGFRVTDENFSKAIPIPFNGKAGEKETSYTMQQLVARVGLPMHNESRFDPLSIWITQSLKDFDPNLVDSQLIARWKTHDAAGILHARDTVFGMYLGRRAGDRPFGSSTPQVTPPPADTPSPALSAFVARVYEFYDFGNTRGLTPDPRRHPPERHGGNRENPGGSLMRYLGGLRYGFAPFHPIGPNWVPDATKFKPSRGLVAMICYDDLQGGSNIDARTTAAQTMGSARTLQIVYADTVDKREMRRRDPLAGVVPDIAGVANVVAHEFGHSFNLGDEYESANGDGRAATQTTDADFDNLTVLGFLRDPSSPAPGRLVDPTKIKWLELPRAVLSAKLQVPSENVAGGIKVTIDPRYIGKWEQAEKDGLEVHLRNFSITLQGRQLPLASATGQHLAGLKVSAVDRTKGTFVLTGAASPLPVYARGSVVYVPLKNQDGAVVPIVHPKVKERIFVVKGPINLDEDHEHVRDKDDKPQDIEGFTPPCNSTRTIGFFEGGNEFSGGFYRPSGSCKMRNHIGEGNFWTEVGQDAGAFCYVCKWLIVNRVDPGYHAILSAAFYPGEL
ncbi:hypothetical protein DL991_31240 [Amycolatopsis sp. WAC 01375]|uniref:M64 family metallopeptidase n=1 Tax=Amycolatopsis sp. WAC 01375 TaxID=2203194 RepID=UPI000F79C700|nr:M64 family metallopeptidase [Amycolatopsis sp. WAC 01375]RSM73758.1 hypothetical protein DL991_31240 [Amycolatopsis sp. WAC 01375]